MINDLSDLQNSPILKQLHFEWTPELVEQFSCTFQTDSNLAESEYDEKISGCYFVIEVFRNMIALTLRQVDTDDDLQISQKDIGRFFNPVLIIMMAKAVRDVHKPAEEHSYYPISDEIREYIKHKLNI